jgi:outer membrane protein TolC
MLHRSGALFVLFMMMVFQPETARAQNGETLTLEAAFEQALEQNHAVQIELLRREESRNNVFRGNAGQLPTLDLTGSGELSRSNSDFDIASFRPDAPPETNSISTDGAQSLTLNAGVELNYTIFEGFSGRYRYRALQSQDRLTQLSSRINIEQTLIEVAAAYFNLLQQEEALDIVEENLALSQARLERVQEARRVGQARQLDELNAEVDRDTDAISVEEARNQRDEARRELLFTLGMEIEDKAGLQLDDRYEASPELELDMLLQRSINQNAGLSLAQEEVRQAEISKNLENSARYPTLSARARYGYTYQDNDSGQLLRLEETGYTAGLSLRYNIFNGGVTRRAVQNAEINIKNRDENQQMMRKQVEKDLMNAYADWQTQQRQRALAQRSERTAQLNFENAQEAFQRGTISSIELREAQQNLQNARLRLSEISYALKQQEIVLLRISGDLVSL